MSDSGEDDPPIEIVAPRRPRLMLGLGAASVLLVVAVVVAAGMLVFSPRGSAHTVASPVPTSGSTGPTAPVLYVHVSGSVARPGLYELTEGARVVDAIGAAGGFADDAVRASVNLARVLKDGEHLSVPSDEDPPDQAGGDSDGGAINLNTATAEQLEQLSGVGPATAGRIIDWREANGPFTSTDDLLQVSGIGEKTLAGFRDEITT